MAAADPAAPPRPSRARRKRLAMAVWSGLATAAILLLLDGVLAGRSLVRNLTAARTELNVGIEALVTGDPRGARPHFQAAMEAADRATGAVGHPALGLAGLLPVAGENLDAVAGVAAASRETALAGAAMVDVAGTLGWTDIGLPAAEAAGRLDVEAMRAAVPRLDAVVTRLRDAAAALEAADDEGLLGPVATGYRDAAERLARRADVTARLRDALRLVPSMFGADEPRRYLVVVPVLGVPQAGGGAPASVGILTAEDGRVRLESLTGAVGRLSPAPAPIAEVEGSPDGPTAARHLLEAAAGAGARDLDGVVWLDTIALAALVEVAGDVKVPMRSPALSAATTATALEIDAFLGTSPRAAGRLHATWAGRVLAAFLARRPGLESFALATADATRRRHLGIFLVDRQDRRSVRALGLDQALPRPEEGVLPLLATWSSDGDDHVGAFVSARIRHDVTLRPDGSVRVRTEVTFENGAAAEPSSVLLGGPGDLAPTGTFSAAVGLLLPADARQIDAETSRPSPIAIRDELRYRSVHGSMVIRAGAAATLTVAYVVPEALAPDEGGPRLVVRLLPQPTIEGISYAVRVRLPEEAALASVSPELSVRGDAVTFTGVRTDPIDLEMRFADR